MDHLVRPRDAHVQPKQVPFLAEENLDKSNLENFRMSKFLEACELDIDDIRHYRQRPPEVLAEFFQTWLFFGLLCCFFEKPVQLRDFTKVEARSPSIYTSNLPRYLHRWKASMRALPREALEMTIKRKKHYSQQPLKTLMFWRDIHTEISYLTWIF
jgi:hypothetical protein